jgi:ATP-dependent helicase HrpB
LPINEALPALAAALASHRGVLLEAPPGAGKSTIVPLFLLDSPWLRAKDPDARTAPHCGPRRRRPHGVPARGTVGRSVGFRTRLETRVSRETRIEVITEGILTRMLQDDSSTAGHRLRDLR